MDIHKINLGDTIRTYGGREVVVVGVYEHETWKEILHETPEGFFLSDGIVRGWLTDSSHMHAILPNWKDFETKRFSWSCSADHVECIVKKAGESSGEKVMDRPGSKLRLERPCPQCKRMNDVGVSQCWHCSRPNP